MPVCIAGDKGLMGDQRAERCAAELGISRAAQDEYAAEAPRSELTNRASLPYARPFHCMLTHFVEIYCLCSGATSPGHPLYSRPYLLKLVHAGYLQDLGIAGIVCAQKRWTIGLVLPGHSLPYASIAWACACRHFR
jgi:hypothetical protein